VTEIRARAIQASHDPEAVATFAALWRSFIDRRHDARPDAAEVSVPVLLAWGRFDPILPWWLDGRRARKALRPAHIETFACGHQPFAEMPDEFLRVIEPFLLNVIGADA
jgi:pimeloyl-ACP methyl ester carboxylesterase